MHNLIMIIIDEWRDNLSNAKICLVFLVPVAALQF